MAIQKPKMPLMKKAPSKIKAPTMKAKAVKATKLVAQVQNPNTLVVPTVKGTQGSSIGSSKSAKGKGIGQNSAASRGSSNASSNSAVSNPSAVGGDSDNRPTQAAT